MLASVNIRNISLLHTFKNASAQSYFSGHSSLDLEGDNLSDEDEIVHPQPQF